jgi:hypothetical protein
MVGLVLLLAATNPMKYDSLQRISGAGALIFAALFLSHTLHIYNKRATATEQTEPTIEKPTGPNFHISLLGAQARIPDFDKSVSGFCVVLSISNAGTSGVVANWSMNVQLKTGKILAGSPVPIADNPATNVNATAQTNNWPDLNIVDTRIDSGGVKKGQLMFYFNEPEATVNTPDSILIVTAQDAFGHRYSAQQRLGDWTQQKIR